MDKAKWIPIVVLRVIAMGATFVATIVMVTSHDSATVLGMTFQAKYNNSPTLKYFVIVCIIATAYSLATLFVPPKKSTWRWIIIFDLVVTSFLISSFSAAVGVGQLGKSGNSHAGWLPICDQVPKFCNHVTGSLISGFVAVILYFLLLLYSLNNVLNLVTISKLS